MSRVEPSLTCRSLHAQLKKAAGEALLGLTGTADGLKLLADSSAVDTLCRLVGGDEVSLC